MSKKPPTRPLYAPISAASHFQDSADGREVRFFIPDLQENFDNDPDIPTPPKRQPSMWERLTSRT